MNCVHVWLAGPSHRQEVGGDTLVKIPGEKFDRNSWKIFGVPESTSQWLNGWEYAKGKAPSRFVKQILFLSDL